LRFPYRIEEYKAHVRLLKENPVERLAAEVQRVVEAPEYSSLPTARRVRQALATHLSPLQVSYSVIPDYHWYRALERLLSEKPGLEDYIDRLLQDQDR